MDINKRIKQYFYKAGNKFLTKEEMKQKTIEHFNTKSGAKSDEISEEQIRKIINLIKIINSKKY